MAKTSPKPPIEKVRRFGLGYLIGWFKVEFNDDHRKAKIEAQRVLDTMRGV